MEFNRFSSVCNAVSAIGKKTTRASNPGGANNDPYADQKGFIVGYAWSETPKSKYYQSPARDLVAGRLTRKSLI